MTPEAIGRNLASTQSGSGDRIKVLAGSRPMPTLVLAYGPDVSRIGERARPGNRQMPLDRASDVFPGGPLGDPEISRRHATIEHEGSAFLLRDAGSKNGTFVNDKPIRDEGCPLSFGDVIRIGHTVLAFRETMVPGIPDAKIDGLHGHSDAARTLRAAIARYAASDVPVLLSGDSGTGKEVAARALGRQGRPGRPFVAFNIASAPRSLVESELFGHAKGAFTGAVEARKGRFRESHTGTLFLDEIGDLPPETQSLLLRVLEGGQVWPVGASAPESVDVRVVSATLRDLATLVEQGAFRHDLYIRIAQLVVRLPTLKERFEDVPLLAIHFANGRRFTAKAAAELMAQAWPFNVRELKVIVQQCLLDAPDSAAELELTDAIRDRLAEHRKIAGTQPAQGQALDRETVEAALMRASGNVTRAAAELGKDRTQIYRVLRGLGLDPRDYRQS